MISIIIATYNAGRHLQACLDSIAALQLPDVEVVAVDGGSSDDTVSILQHAGMPALRWISEPDKGIYDALNKGARMARGQWLYFLGADDRLLPGFRELALLVKEEDTLYYGNSEPFYGDSKDRMELLTGRFSRYRLAKHCMNHQAIIYPAAAFRKYAYDLRYKVYADYALNIRVWGDNGIKRVYHPVSIVRYDMTGFSSIANDIPFKQDKLRLIRESMGWLMYIRMLLKKYKKKLQGEKDFWEI
jgi:glycosyltransferase involved in cell wall biosynthesis